MIDPALDGLSELVELGKKRTEPWRGCERSRRGRHVCTGNARMSVMGDDTKEQSP